jgi:monoamine oxidase
VTKITYRGEGVELEVGGGKRYQARRALVTVSTGVLEAGKLQFDPPLPARKLAALEGLPMGHMQKVIIDFKDREGLLGDTLPNSWVLYQAPDNRVMAFVIKPLGKNIAIGFFGGEQAKELEQQCASAVGDKPLPPERQPCDEEAVQRAKAALVRMYGSAGGHPRAGLELSRAVDTADIYVTRWSLEPWTLGAYSAARPGAWRMREELSKPLPYDERDEQEDRAKQGAGRVYFAGEATARPMFNGSFAGAYESGLRGARELLGSLEEEEASSRRRPEVHLGAAEAPSP